MAVRATVLIPTHSHVSTLPYSVRSAMEQTVGEIEILVVGDGAPDEAGRAVEEAAAGDPRVRYFPNPKGAWQGEAHRHRILSTEARGDIVTYLADDDLYLPDHVETMEAALGGCDFAGALPIEVLMDGTLSGWNCDLALPEARRRFLAGENRLPLSCGAHTMEAYLRLPSGWTPASPGVWSDLFFWQQFIKAEGMRMRSVHRPTVLHFPQSKFGGWKSPDQVGRLSAWLDRIRSAEGRTEVLYLAVSHLAASWSRAELGAPRA